MQEKDLIKNLKSLKQIEPKKEWVSLTKQEILGKEERIPVLTFIFNHKPAFASATLFSFMVVTLVLSYNALPGDTLFPVRKTTERVELMARLEKAQDLVIAQRRIEDLKRAQERAERNMEPVVAEVRTTISEIARVAKDPEATQQVIDMDREIKSLGVSYDSQEVEELYKREVEAELERLKETSLTEEQEEQLEKAIELQENQEYAEAYEIVLKIGY